MAGSLRDQLVAAGLASKKRARAAEIEQRKEQKQQAGNLDKKRVRDEREAAAKAAAEQARVEALRAARAERDAARAVTERSLRVRQLIKAHEVRAGGPVRYHHKTPSGKLGVLQVSSGVAQLLRTGQVAVAIEDHGTRVRYVLIPAAVAETIAAIQPGAIAHWTRGAVEEAVPKAPERDWLPDLRARRATPEDLERFRQGSGATNRRL